MKIYLNSKNFHVHSLTQDERIFLNDFIEIHCELKKRREINWDLIGNPSYREVYYNFTICLCSSYTIRKIFKYRQQYPCFSIISKCSKPKLLNNTYNICTLTYDKQYMDKKFGKHYLKNIYYPYIMKLNDYHGGPNDKQTIIENITIYFQQIFMLSKEIVKVHDIRNYIFWLLMKLVF